MGPVLLQFYALIGNYLPTRDTVTVRYIKFTVKGVFGKSGEEMFFFQYGFLKVVLGKSWFARNDLCLDS